MFSLALNAPLPADLPPRWQLRFTLPGHSGPLLAAGTLQASWEGGRALFSLGYDCGRPPLGLSASAQPGDEVLLDVGPARLGLYVNGALRDEEWPLGRPLLSGPCRRLAMPAAIRPSGPLPAPAPEAPASLQGWKPRNRGDNFHIGDCMPFVQGDTFHLFCLYDRRGHQSKWGLGAHQWGHLCSGDLRSWREFPLAVAIDRPEEGSICTGSVAYHAGIYYAFYAIRACDGSPARLSWSTSADGVHFVKSGRTFSLGPPYDAPSARDPKVFRDEQGLFHMLVTTSLVGAGESRGCLAHLTSPDLLRWTQLGPLVTLDIADQPECTDYFYRQGFYYLIYSNFGVARYFLSRSPLGPWTAPAHNVVVDRDYRVPKCALWRGRILFAGFRIDPGVQWGGRVHMYEAHQEADGSLRFGGVPEMPGISE